MATKIHSYTRQLKLSKIIMKKRIAFRQLSRTSAHRWSMLCNMVTSLVNHERIVTTVPKAKELRRIADKVVGYAKDGIVISNYTFENSRVIVSFLTIHSSLGSLHARRQADKIICEKPALTKLFEVLGPRYDDRDGGYTRVMKLSKPRKGDNAPMAVIEYIDRPGEIRAARPPVARKEKILQTLSDVLTTVGITPIVRNN